MVRRSTRCSSSSSSSSVTGTVRDWLRPTSTTNQRSPPPTRPTRTPSSSSMSLRSSRCSSSSPSSSVTGTVRDWLRPKPTTNTYQRNPPPIQPTSNISQQDTRCRTQVTPYSETAALTAELPQDERGSRLSSPRNHHQQPIREELVQDIPLPPTPQPAAPPANIVDEADDDIEVIWQRDIALERYMAVCAWWAAANNLQAEMRGLATLGPQMYHHPFVFVPPHPYYLSYARLPPYYAPGN